MSPIIVELAGDPQGKGRPRFRVIKTRGGATFGNAYTPAKTRSYETALRGEAQVVMGGRKPLDGALAVRVTAFIGIPASWSKKKQQAARDGLIRPTSKPDWENIAKTTDAFKGVVWLDDKQVVDGSVVKFYSDEPRLRVEVSAIS